MGPELVSATAASAATGAFAKLSEAFQRTPPEESVADELRAHRRAVRRGHDPAAAQGVAGREPAADRRAAGAEGNPEDRAPRRARCSDSAARRPRAARAAPAPGRGWQAGAAPGRAARRCCARRRGADAATPCRRLRAAYRSTGSCRPRPSPVHRASGRGRTRGIQRRRAALPRAGGPRLARPGEFAYSPDPARAARRALLTRSAFGMVRAMLDKTYRPAEVEAKHDRLWQEGGYFRPVGRPRRAGPTASSCRRPTSPAACTWATRSTTRSRTR